MAALRAGVKTVIIPAENEPDLDEIDQTVRSSLNFITTDNIDEVLDIVIDFSSADVKLPVDGGSSIIENDAVRSDTGGVVIRH